MATKDVQLKDLLTLEEGSYSDGSPLDQVHYLECKLILKPDRFTSAPSFLEFGKLVGQAADSLGVGFSTKGFKGLKPRIREVVFLDTSDFRLYNHAFILRRRIAYEDGFPVGDPEIVFKFRHPDLQTAANLDVRPNIPGQYRIKFKAEALPLRDKIGGLRMLYSHNVEFGLGQAHDDDRTSMGTLAHAFPCLASLKKSNTERVEFVHHTIVEEVLQDLGELNFGKGCHSQVERLAMASAW
jgi:hypothetical protein